MIEQEASTAEQEAPSLSLGARLEEGYMDALGGLIKAMQLAINQIKEREVPGAETLRRFSEVGRNLVTVIGIIPLTLLSSIREPREAFKVIFSQQTATVLRRMLMSDEGRREHDRSRSTEKIQDFKILSIEDGVAEVQVPPCGGNVCLAVLHLMDALLRDRTSFTDSNTKPTRARCTFRGERYEVTAEQATNLIRVVQDSSKSPDPAGDLKRIMDPSMISKDGIAVVNAHIQRPEIVFTRAMISASSRRRALINMAGEVHRLEPETVREHLTALAGQARIES